MAEFQIIAKEIERMCKTYQNKCRTDKCPLYLEDLCYAQAMSHIYECEAGKLEDVVMRWAAEHPEPVYPTWVEWLNSIGLTKHDTGQFCVHKPNLYSYEIKEVDILNEAAYKPIPADIAQKLGIEPKEDANE